MNLSSPSSNDLSELAFRIQQRARAWASFRHYALISWKGILYAATAFLPPIGILLSTHDEGTLTEHVVLAAIVEGLVQACIALKAFTSQWDKESQNFPSVEGL